MQEQNNSVERVLLECRKNLSISCVESVDGFNEQSLKLTVMGSKLIIVGENIKITAFNKASGNLCAEGNILEIKYQNKKAPVMKRIFK